MKNRNEKMKVSILTVAVQGALIAMFATPTFAAEIVSDEVAALKRPTNSVEIGVANTSKASAKFGEYNGLDAKGAGLVGNFVLQGGDAYSGDGTMRWVAKGTDLGTTSRSLEGSLSNQGQWNVDVGYDSLRHNITDTYQTPQQGSMGGNVFTLPPTFGTVNGASTAMSTPGSNSSRDIVNDPNQKGAFHTEKVGTTRENTLFGVGYTINDQWSVKFDYNHLKQTGAKLIAGSSYGSNTGTAAFPATPGNNWRAEAVSILMNPTNYKTDTFNLALNWIGEKGHITGGYYGSIFTDGYNSLSWENSFLSNATALTPGGLAVNASSRCASGGYCTYQTNIMGTAPGNEFHQINLSGGYAFTPATKLTGGFSYGRNTQNDNYADALMTTPSPQTSLNGLVITTHVDLKLTNQTTKDLSLSAALKYNDRDNRTASNTYNYKILASGNPYVGVSTPYSNKKTQIELAGDYRLTQGQNLRLAYERENISRGCNNVVGGVECVASPSSTEDKLGIGYRLSATDTIKLNAAYAYAKRSAVFDHTFRANVGNYSIVTPTGSTSLNAGDFLGFVAYPYASRKQNMLKAGVNWQATEQIDIGLNGRYTDDKYDAVLGVQDGQSTSVNLDANYSYNEESSVAAYASIFNGKRNLRDGAASTASSPAATPTASVTVAPQNIWTNQLTDSSNVLGVNTKHGGLLGGKVEVIGDLSYSLDKSRYSTQLLYTTATACSATTVLTCGDTPDIKTNVVTLKLTGNYQVEKNAKVTVLYIYQKLVSEDFFYNGEAFGYTSGRMMPTGQQAPNYVNNVVAVTYSYLF